MINIKNNYDLFSDIVKSLNFTKNLIPYKSENKIIVHFYWRVPLEFGRKQVLPIKSVLVNNYDINKNNLEINLWSNVDLSDNEYLKELKDYINIKVWDPFEELKGTILEENIDYYKQNIIHDSKNWIASDFFRLLCLHKYGGFYFDMDVLILRDLSPLNNLEFLYQWGSSGTTPNEPNIFYNGAIMRLNKESSASLKLVKETLNIRSAGETTNWSSIIYSKIIDNNLNYLPCAWFNTEWCLNDNDRINFFNDINYNMTVFKKENNIELFEGAFTWHWHNKWTEPIEEGSKFETLEKKINEKYKKIINNEI
jgi:hypothetical protein